MQAIRVLHLIHHLDPGGAETLLAELLPRLDRDRFEVHVACLQERGALYERLAKDGVRTHFIGRGRGPDLPAIRRIARLLRGSNIDVLNTHAFSAGFWGRMAAAWARTPVVIATVHAEAGWQNPVKHFVGAQLMRPLTSHTVAVSETVRTSLLLKHRLDRNTVSVIPNGIPLEKFQRPVVERPAGIPRDRPVVGMVGRCRAEKGGAFFIECLALLRAAGHGVYGVLVGDGPDRERLRADAHARGLTPHITFAGRVTDATRWLAAFDVLVCPSLEESFGIAALEAQAAGVPVVATRVGGFREVLHDGRNALLVPASNARALADAVSELLTTPARRDALVREAREHVARRFSIASTVQAYERLYSGLLKERNTS
jgi:glycosyltransferase involved in cell wall biosynthesis